MKEVEYTDLVPRTITLKFKNTWAIQNSGEWENLEIVQKLLLANYEAKVEHKA